MNSTERGMIESLLKGKNRLCTSYEVGVPNCFTQHDNEADLFFIRNSGFTDEVEIKVSRSDLLSDKNKRVWHRNIAYDEFNWKEKGFEFCPSTKPKYEALTEGLMSNYFWYAIKEGIGGIEDIPDFAGLLIIDPDGFVKVKRSPKRLHRNKLTDFEKYKIARKCFYRYLKSEFKINF